MIYLFDERIKALLQEEIDKVANAIADGNIGSYEEYKFKVGIIRGLRMAFQYIDEVATAIKNQ